MGNASSAPRAKSSKTSKASSKKQRNHGSKKGKGHKGSKKDGNSKVAKNENCSATVETNQTSGDLVPEVMVLKMLDGVPKDAPEDLRVVREWIHRKNMHDVDGMKELTHPNCDFCFVDSESEMPAREFYEVKKLIYGSFPDLHFFWKSMKIGGTNSFGTDIVIEDYYGIGTHTGRPFGFGPYDPIPPTGLTVQDEYIEFTITVKDGKITRATIDAFGQMVGPPGFYTKIGGLIM